jgi:hypothetical protein
MRCETLRRLTLVYSTGKSSPEDSGNTQSRSREHKRGEQSASALRRWSSTCVCQFDCRRRRSLTIPIWKIFNWIYFRLWILYVDSDLHKCDGAPSQHEKNQKKIKSNQIKYIYVDGLDIIIYTWCLHTFKSLMTRNWEMVLHQYGTRNYFQDK